MAITQVSNSLVKQDLTISGGTVDNTVIGSGTPAAGTFTTVAGTLASTVTGTTQAASDNSTKIATTAYVTTALANLVDSAPGTLNTLNELAAALGDDASFSTTVTNSIAAKAALSGSGQTIADSGNFAIDAAGDIHLDADSEAIRIRHDGGDIGIIQMTSNDLILRSMVSDKDLIFKGNDGGSVITALTLDMSEAGAATFNSSIAAPTIKATSEFQIFSGGTDIGAIFNSGGALTIQGTSTRDVSIGSDSYTNAVFVEGSNGNVGIGTGSPSYPFHVSTSNENAAFIESSSNNGTYLWVTNSDATTGRTANIGFAPANNVSGARIFAEAMEDFSSSANRTADLGFSTRLNGTMSEKMRIKSDGDVNIGGSTAANRTLEIKGASNNDGYLGTFGSGYSLQVARHPLTGVFNNTSTAAAAINLFSASADSAIAFYTTTSNNANPTERMRIDKNGTVGIGFSQPAHSGLGSMLSVGAQNIVGNSTSGGYVGYNMYYNSGNWKYQVGAGSALLSFAASGDFTLRQATSGSAGNTISYSETLKIERSTGYLIAQGASNVRLVLGSQGNSSNNTSNWIRGNSTEVDINTAGGAFNVELAGSKKLALTATQLELQSGVNLRVASGQGIDFGATTDGFATETSELLDDYEEGTWTPVWTNNTQTLSVNSARYVKVGKLVYVYAYISNIYPATGGGTQYLSGLPYPVVNATFYGGLTIAYAGAASFPALGNSTANVAILVQNNNTTLYFHSVGGGTQSVLTESQWNTIYSGLGGTIRALIFNGCYEVG